MNFVLADTGPLYALVDPDDRYHLTAQQQVNSLMARGLRVAVLQPTLLEAYTLVLRKLGLSTAHRWLRELTLGIDLLNPTAEDYEAARERVMRFPDQKITLFDSCSAVVCERLGLVAWTYDHHFDLMRIPVWRAD